MCWNKIGSPPPAAAKNVVLKCLSVNSIVIPAASAGRATTSNTEVIKTLHTNRGMRNRPIPAGRIFIIVTIMLMAPMIDEAPARCILSIARSTEAPACDFMLLSGGYKVQPVPAPSKNIELVSR